MFYLACTLGFICGFILGQMVLSVLLRGYSKEELMENKSLRWYGFLNWIFAIGGAAAAANLYNHYFL